MTEGKLHRSSMGIMLRNGFGRWRGEKWIADSLAARAADHIDNLENSEKNLRDDNLRQSLKIKSLEARIMDLLIRVPESYE